MVTKDGYKASEDITVGDEVLAKNALTGEQDWRPITETFVIPDNEVYELLLDTGDATPSRLTVSETHPFYVPARGWVESQSLNPGDVIETDTFSAAVVISLNDLHCREATYNFTVDEFHSYYVSQDRVLVHNQNGIVCNLTGDGEVTKNADHYIPDAPLAKQRVNGQDIPLPLKEAEGRAHTVLGSRVGSDGKVYRQSAEFPANTWPKANGKDVPMSEVHWSNHGRGDHLNPHQHPFKFDGKGWVREGGNGLPFKGQ